MDKIPYRQIHLDFHTSPYIEGIGDEFNSEEWVKTLKDAHVNSINIFTKCHHGMFYYNTKIGTIHPYLKNGLDLFGEQVRVAKANNIRAIAYTCVAWNEDTAYKHPEWKCINYNGLSGGTTPFANDFYRWNSLCINNEEYRKLIKAEIKEIYDNYKPDGYWIDIVVGKNCVCNSCQEKMMKAGLNPQNYDDVLKHNVLSEIDYCREFYKYIKSLDSNIEIYFNSHPYELDNASDLEISTVTKRKYFSFIDIESLPSDVWGYNHFPIASNYVSKYDLEHTMMNGKFHFAWGDFGSIRNLEALQYECFRAISYGAKVCIGDQLHPNGKLDTAVYQRIGQVFGEIEDKEPWLINTKKVCEVGVYIGKNSSFGNADMNAIDDGVNRVLTENKIPFDFLNNNDDISRYKLVILPENINVDEKLTIKLRDFKNNGGKLLVTGKSGFNTNGKFFIDDIDISLHGESEFAMNYIRFNDDMFKSIPQMDHINYEKGYDVSSSLKPLAVTVNPYFNRTYNKFCSHRQTPPKLDISKHPAIVGNDFLIYISGNLFSDYAKNGYKVHKDIIMACIDKLLPNRILHTDAPYITELTLRQRDDGLVLHMLNFVKERKCKNLDIIEADYLIKDKYVKVKCDFTPKSVKQVPNMENIDFSYAGEYVTLNIDFASNHTMYFISK